MAYKTISVVVTDQESDAAALGAAIALAQAGNAHLDVHCLALDMTRLDTMPMAATAMVLDIAMVEARAKADALVAWAQGKLPPELTQSSVQAVVMPNIGLDPAVARLVRYADLVVAGRPYGQGRSALQAAVVEAALFGSGAPVLVVPDAPKDGARDYARPFARAVVAWNEGGESMTAIRRALPVLQAADHVDVVMVDPPAHSPERSDPGGQLCVMLSRHGIRAEVSILSRTMPRVSEVIMRFAREHAADVVVMGAYGHSRFRESILGGATRDMLESAPLPMLMAH